MSLPPWLTDLATIVGLISFIPIAWTWYAIIWGRKRQHDAWYNEARTGASADIVLVVDLLPNSHMLSQVRQYLANEKRDVPDKRFIVFEHNGDLTPDNIPSLVQELRKKIAEISHMGAGTLHIFFGGPCAFATIVGCELANRGNVIVHHHPREGGYENWGPLRHAHF